MADTNTATDKETEAFGDHGDNTDELSLVIIVNADGTKRMGSLPPITDIIIPKTGTKSALIRWLYAIGYDVKTIYAFLGIKYQMVRNIVTTIPKRAAREDLPPLEVRYKPEKDMLDEAMDGALEASLLAGRKERIKANKLQPKSDEGGEDE